MKEPVMTADIQQAVKHFNILSEGITNPQALFALLINHGHGRQSKPRFIQPQPDKLIKVLEGIGKDISSKNIYISANTFYKNSTRLEFLHKLNFLFIDIDCHSDNIPSEHDISGLLFYLEDEFWGSKVPKPSLIISTGRGLHIYWKIKTMSYNQESKVFWNNVEQALLKQFSNFCFNDFEVDTKVSNPNRVLRLAGTYNPKANKFANIISNCDEQYTLTDIWQGYLADYTPKEHIEYSESQENSLLSNRVSDLEKLILLRKGYVNGYRQFIIWVARNSLLQLGYNEKKIALRLNRINDLFAEALPQQEINHEVSRKDIYAFTNQYLISQLKITAREQKELKSIVGIKEKRKRLSEIRSKEAQQKREEKSMDKEAELKKIKSYINDGYSQAQIAGILGVSIRKIKSCYKKIGINKSVKSNKQNILDLKRQGYTQKQTAEKLNISISTVRTHWNKY